MEHLRRGESIITDGPVGSYCHVTVCCSVKHHCYNEWATWGKKRHFPCSLIWIQLFSMSSLLFPNLVNISLKCPLTLDMFPVLEVHQTGCLECCKKLRDRHEEQLREPQGEEVFPMSRHQWSISPVRTLPELAEYVVQILLYSTVEVIKENIVSYAAQDRALVEKASKVGCEPPRAIAQLVFSGLFIHHGSFLQNVFPKHTCKTAMWDYAISLDGAKICRIYHFPYLLDTVILPRRGN